MPELIDLHVHSNISDGTFSPEEIIQMSVQKNLKAIALTDHDTTNGIERALAKASNFDNFELIPGIEMSCIYNGTEIHILGYYPDYKNSVFLHELASLRGIRERRNISILEKLQNDGFEITMDDLLEGNPDTVITRAHFARALCKHGYVSSMNQAFSKYLYYGSKYCQRNEIVTPEKAMDVLRTANAFPVLAHPMLYKLGYNQIAELIEVLIPLGLKGIEVYHSSNNAYESQKLREITRFYKLFPTGGSDFHGSNKPDISLGSGRGNLRVSYLLLKDIKEYLSGRDL